MPRLTLDSIFNKGVATGVPQATVPSKDSPRRRASENIATGMVDI
jgi:hypothetical protein